jgi:hypothetical protein
MSRQFTLSTAAVAIAVACLPLHAAQRAFVSSTGSDANACTPSGPCRSFQAAHASVDAGGEIVALDAAGYGAVTITKSVSILGNPGFVTSVSVASGDGITIATGGVNVILRNLYINGVGGNFGVNMSAGTSLTLENCVVANFANSGVRVIAQAEVRIIDSTLRGNDLFGAIIAGNAAADIINSRFIGNASAGLHVESSTGGLTTAAVSDSVSSGNGVGFVVNATSGTSRLAAIRTTAANNSSSGFHNQASSGATAITSIGSSMASANGTGFSNAGAGTATFESLGNNIVRQNGTASSGTITATAGQ